MNSIPQILIIVAIILLFVVFGIIIYAFNSFPSEREEDDKKEYLKIDKN